VTNPASLRSARWFAGRNDLAFQHRAALRSMGIDPDAYAGRPVIGNPGYPVSAVLSFEQFAAPLISGLAGKLVQPRPTLTVYPAQNLPSKPGLTEFIRVTLGRVGDKVIATPLPRGAGVWPCGCWAPCVARAGTPV